MRLWKILSYRNRTEKYESETDEEEETAQEKSVRLAKKYIQQIEAEGKGKLFIYIYFVYTILFASDIKLLL